MVEAALGDQRLIETIGAVVDRVAGALGDGHKVLLAGNGGSAGDAQHIAGELVGRFAYDRAAAAAIALTTDSSVLTAIANDYGYDAVFERQVQGLGRPGDVLIAFSTSGRSLNILKAIAAARSGGLVTIGFTGKGGGDMAARCDLSLCAPADSTPLIQQLHITLGHIVCETGRGTAVPESCHAAAARRHRRLNEHARILPKTGRSKHVLPQQ